ncbi:thyroid receptor-interacting protein 6-like [Schistocerca americana]|uniref:thyroid receptor-interacting protein 6-like n=1 Tax=Schistocerca americana TaxID=7009 RepID=UPI001F5026DC|nr:thyroid receptor-interacting protein 6-like [Schistocerca americana]
MNPHYHAYTELASPHSPPPDNSSYHPHHHHHHHHHHPHPPHPAAGPGGGPPGGGGGGGGPGGPVSNGHVLGAGGPGPGDHHGFGPGPGSGGGGGGGGGGGPGGPGGGPQQMHPHHQHHLNNANNNNNNSGNANNNNPAATTVGGGGPGGGPASSAGPNPNNNGGPANNNNNNNCTGGTVKVCAGCGGKIVERFLLHALDRYWHNGCLKCSCCGAMLADIGGSCFTKANMILCKTDYIRLFGSSGACSACGQTIPASEFVMRAGPQHHVFHLKCFACSKCGGQLVPGDRYCLLAGSLVCEQDWHKLLKGSAVASAAAAEAQPGLSRSVPARPHGRTAPGGAAGRQASPPLLPPTPFRHTTRHSFTPRN